MFTSVLASFLAPVSALTRVSVCPPFLPYLSFVPPGHVLCILVSGLKSFRGKTAAYKQVNTSEV